ncbi:alanine--tRNA ligase [Phycicoccus endophyticus]|uniref:Alanine--tRNA ligase n=1 Tax=Phycicoccus endophyticus TaxID=1690220 RepID=A0A7G9R473_9MICO|nr:alanine--tRNA ligase [Phycicoccus endophyticus]NHI18249.1 alanine--tRNA ligase [Phycicoccus endophyticus]QNN50398.1 alanine--tRNA ligase [Phycicoccus endophyticus]GGL25219.1 alanine--tRNA ligase [Phycicoccus endophyticus]
MDTAEIRRRWLDFFGRNGHTVVPSASLLLDDPNLLFVNAGMVPFKPYFLGQESAPYARATSVQKCIRTQDIEEVGKTSRHGTFFQMNGNFSFGDYFKEGAIRLAWELVTTPQDRGGFGIDGERLWATVYEDDDEAIELWTELTDIPAERIVRRGKADNYWHMGVPGPGGPCSEIFYDRGPEYGPDGGPEVDEDRFMEFWNLVFMQYELSAVRAKDDFDVKGELPRKNIDTGMGLERIASILQGVDTMYEIDEVYPVLERAAQMTGKRYGEHSGHAAGSSHPDDVRLRVVADHVRSSLMLLGDGVTPGNEGRGYVLRRMLRRAVRSMRLLGHDDACLPDLLPVSLERMERSYPELRTDWERISQTAYAEEDAFRRTLSAGTTILDTAVARTRQSGGSVLSGDEAFQLHDTYGFPIDLTLEMAAEQGLEVDREGFTRLMTEQRQRAKADARAKKTGHGDTSVYRALADGVGQPVEFTGYHEVVSEGRVAGLLRDGAPVASAVAGDDVEVVLDRTPFYAEGGGQLADAGLLRLGSGALVEVRDVQSPITGLVVHKATVVQGEVATGESALAQVDIERRRSISRAHTATHMVHKAIREALGETATQAGSENSPGRFRFDFHASSALPPSVLRDVEARVNALLLDDLAVRADVMTQQEAREAGAMALFGEKYGEAVRVVSVGEWARELCGGTHAEHTTQLGLVTLLGESSIGSGVRRVEALVGTDAFSFLARERAIVGQLTELVKGRPEELPERVGGLLARLKDAERDLERLRAERLRAEAGSLTSAARDVGGVTFLGHDAGETGADEVRAMVLDLRGRLGGERPSVVAVTGAAKGRPVVVVATNEPARSRGIRAGDLVRAAAQALGGGGGGKDDIAQGGGQDPTKVGEALAAVEWRVGELAG